jgi:hypothetical protein
MSSNFGFLFLVLMSWSENITVESKNTKKLIIEKKSNVNRFKEVAMTKRKF